MNILELNSNLKIWGVADSFNILLAPKSLLIGSGAKQVMELLGLLFLFCLILAGAMFTTRLVAGKAVGLRNNNIKIIETYRISNSSAIQIIRVADKYLAVAISKDKITVLAELDGDNIIISNSETQMQGIDFSDILGKARDKIISSAKCSKKVD